MDVYWSLEPDQTVSETEDKPFVEVKDDKVIVTPRPELRKSQAIEGHNLLGIRRRRCGGQSLFVFKGGRGLDARHSEEWGHLRTAINRK